MAPNRVEMMPFWSTLRIMVASTKYMRPFLSTAIPVGEERKVLSDDPYTETTDGHHRRSPQTSVIVGVHTDWRQTAVTDS